ncbi:polynucleotide adenylyltransferase PcnB [Aliiglaciecola sp. CAU 1673]|uniref:polynucleotide adenylyltransferase PcnB n=1 Tax=Aliiglaciecola sp. CAU 1673 TaxID=3032595 RepID=UPI0023DC5C79|nr:polynucleotide adenylyltransferase PcnB [Aliiglaciecola sp. CAU 1673]MDF2177807.1 polynucleotide adenylyltransferase PcnB [Aliiglaciecola sp. CAU 1673]
MPRADHSISRSDISENALKVLYRLHNAGFQAFLVGGCVRDMLMGLHPKDYDVATDATPEQVKELFRNCRLIGRRFRLAHVVFGRDVIEVATFRGHHQEEDDEQTAKLSKRSDEGLLLRDNVFGSLEEDAERRDFTINAMYYNIADFSVADFAGGMQAIKAREIRLIGDPETRYREDPVRMLRAVRFAAKLDMKISASCGDLIPKLAPLLANIPPARLFEEVLKLFMSGHGLRTYELLQQYGLFNQLFPQLQPLLKKADSKESQLIRQVLINTDERVNQDMKVTPAFLYAAFLWYPVDARCQELQAEGGISPLDAFNMAVNDVLHRQLQRIMIPKRFSLPMRDIWALQHRLSRRFGRRAYQLLEHPKFRAAYDFLLLRAEQEGGELEELGKWWTDFQDADAEGRKALLDSLREGGVKTSRSRSKRRRPRTKKPVQ